MVIIRKLLDIPIKASYTFLVNCNNFRFIMEVFLVRRFSLLAFALSFCLCLSACSSGGKSVPVPEESTPAVPEYSLINSDEYVQGGETGIGYRVAIGDGATEEEMRAVFSDLCSGDVYSLHTVWFYGLPGDVEDIGSFSVGMLEDTSGKEPVFTPCNYDADLIAALRAKAKSPEESGDAARSIPSPTIKQEALVENNRFEPVDEIIFSTPASENGLGDTPFWVEGEFESRSDLGGYDTIQLSTEYGDLYISAAFIDFPEISEGDEATVFFVYSGFSDALGAPCGVYVYHE